MVQDALGGAGARRGAQGDLPEDNAVHLRRCPKRLINYISTHTTVNIYLSTGTVVNIISQYPLNQYNSLIIQAGPTLL